ncbi:hypothetical protein [Methyloceanibacter sp.]|uniref:hypothetical protein n=1 Tax=Methyloceanibacter sp. TaxID=1965321 RepID=UPI003D6D1182
MEILQSKNPKVRMAMLGAFLLLPFLAFAVWHWASRQSGTGDELTRIVEEYGYSAVTPPSRLFGPGTITMVERRSDGTLKLHTACNIDGDTLAAMWSKSPTINRSLVSAVKQTFESSASTLDLAESDTTGKRVKGTDVALRNINIVTISYEDLSRLRSEYVKGGCEQNVLHNLRAGAAVCQPEEVLEADVVYKQNVQDGLGGGGKIKVTGAGTGSINVDQQTSETSEMQGNDLFLGARLSEGYCFRLDGQGLAGNF